MKLCLRAQTGSDWFRGRGASRRVLAWAFSGFVCSLLFVSRASALPNGFPNPSCPGCHGEGEFDGSVELMADGEVAPGEQTGFTLTITESQMVSAGFFIYTEDSLGTMSVDANSGAKSVTEGIVQSRPMMASNGTAQLHFTWTAPADPGATAFIAYVVAANNDGSSKGDRTAVTNLDVIWGCDPITLYQDIDGDGFGEDDYTRLDCGERDGWVTTPGDCNDLWASIHPGATELANQKDDNCDGQVDEGIEIGMLYRDQDGDGFGDVLADPIQGEVGLEGYAPNNADCDDFNADINPDAEEVCDGLDNNCDKRRDEGLFQQCGVGRCARRIDGCDEECVPGTPMVEECNGLDDDCDGVINNGAQCPEGQVCDVLRCVPADQVGSASAPDGTQTPSQGASELNGVGDATNAGESVAGAGSTAQPGVVDGNVQMADMSLTPGTQATGSYPSTAASGVTQGVPLADDRGAPENAASCTVSSTGRHTGLLGGLGLLLFGAVTRRRRAPRRGRAEV